MWKEWWCWERESLVEEIQNIPPGSKFPFNDRNKLSGDSMSNSFKSKKKSENNITCYKYGGVGHMALNCLTKSEVKEKKERKPKFFKTNYSCS